MSDETRIEMTATTVTVTKTVIKSGLYEHWCDHPGCKRWGSFGYAGRQGSTWFCGDHRPAD